MHVEWLKAYQRSCRQVEEVKLIKEEMQRTPISLCDTADKWDAHRQWEAETSPEHAEGVRAYATQQADLFWRLTAHFENMWKDVLDANRDAKVAGDDGIDEDIGHEESEDEEDERFMADE